MNLIGFDRTERKEEKAGGEMGGREDAGYLRMRRRKGRGKGRRRR